MDRLTGLASRRPLPHHSGEDIVVVTDEDAALSLLAHRARVAEPASVMAFAGGLPSGGGAA
jgi:hypothetical protein